MGNIIALIVTVLLAVGAIVYIVVSKKRGKKCIGCPGGCSSKSHSCDTCVYHSICAEDETE